MAAPLSPSSRRRTRITESSIDRRLQASGDAEPTESFVEVHPGEAEVELGPQELHRIGVRRRRDLVEELVEAAVDPYPVRVSAHHSGP